MTLLMFFGVLSGIMARRLARLDLGFDATAVTQVTVDPGLSVPACYFPGGLLFIIA